MKARLASYKTDGRTDLAFPVPRALIGIGREAGNLIQLPHDDVSKKHATIRPEGEGWEIQDLDSTNGTFVNKSRVKRSVLKDGDRVGFGPHELVFEVVPDNAEWVPNHVIEMSTKVGLKTMPGRLDRPADYKPAAKEPWR